MVVSQARPRDCAKRKGVNAELAFVSSLNPGCPTAIWWLGDLKISFFCCVLCVGHDGFLQVGRKNATVSFKKHRDSKCYREAVEVMLTH